MIEIVKVIVIVIVKVIVIVTVIVIVIVIVISENTKCVLSSSIWVLSSSM